MLGDALLRSATVETDDQGFPLVRTGRPITAEEIKAMIDEDGEWEITRGDPDHPYYADHSGQEPIVTCGPTGLPEVRFVAKRASEASGKKG